MSWLYAFVEKGEGRFSKLGVAEDHYHDRFAMTQQCNPVPMEIAATWRFPGKQAAKQCESEIKRRKIFPKWNTGGPEWFRTSVEAIHASQPFADLLSELAGVRHAPLKFSRAFAESLNIGSKDFSGSRYRPHLYLISHEPSTDTCKLALSCYNWPTVQAHYVTYNPRTLRIAGRWSFRDEIAGKAFVENLTRQCGSRRINPLNWFQIETEEMGELISRMGAVPYPRANPIDDRVHYTKNRVPIN